MTVYMFVLTVPAAAGPSVTVPAGNGLANRSKRRNVVPPSKSDSWVPRLTQDASIHGRRPSLVSMATITVAGALMVNDTSGSAVAVLESLAVRIQGAPTTSGGALATVKTRSPKSVSSGWKLACTDQSAALAASATVRLLMVRSTPPVTVSPAVAYCVAVELDPVTVTA